MLAIVWLIFGFASLVGMLTTRRVGGELTGRCRCGYELQGLPEDALCPECGERARATTPGRSELVYRVWSGRMWLAAIVLMFVMTIASVRGDILVLSYLTEGFSLQQARAAIPMRGSLDEDSLVGWASPIALAISLLPIFARLDFRLQWSWARVWLGAATLFSLTLVLGRLMRVWEG